MYKYTLTCLRNTKVHLTHPTFFIELSMYMMNPNTPLKTGKNSFGHLATTFCDTIADTIIRTPVSHINHILQ